MNITRLGYELKGYSLPSKRTMQLALLLNPPLLKSVPKQQTNS